MLRLQHKSVRNRRSLWFKLVLISAAGHLVLLSLLFFVYRGSVIDLALTVRAGELNNLVDVIFVRELPAHVRGKNSSSGQKTGKANSVRPSQSAEASREGRKRAKGMNGKKAKPSGPKTQLKTLEDKKRSDNPSPLASSGQAPSLEAVHAEPAKYQGERGKKKKEIKKKQEKKNDEKKDTVRNPSHAQGERLIEKNHVIEKSENPVRPELAKDREATRERSDLDLEENLDFQICNSYRELEALQQFQELQQEISRCWRPPVGIAQTVSCQIAVTFDWEGKLVNMEMVKPSGVLMFDVSSRNAVAAMEAPKFVRGKTFTITFKP